ncbi:Amino acid permease/ SLC12A domain-containing protein [[Candida] zeylanoides]
MSGYTVILIFLATVALSVLAWIFAPKENRTVWRSSVILGLSMCYLMWAITYLAQLHPSAFGFQYWNNPGAFADGFKGVANVFVFASTFYSGTESIAVAASEARNPSKAVPKAIRQTFWRILFVYMGVAISYGMTVPWNDDRLKNGGAKSLQSPITLALLNAGWGGAPHLVNAVILVTCISAINSSIYIGSRTIVNLAAEGSAPRFLRWVNKWGVPYPAVILMNAFGLISLMNISTGAADAYGYIVNLSGVAVFIVWGSVSFVHFRFRKAWRLQGRSLDELPFKALWFPWLSWFGLIFNIFLGLIQGWSYFKPFNAKSFVDSYILLPFFVVLYAFLKIVNKTKLVKLDEVDLDEGRRQDVDQIEKIL